MEKYNNNNMLNVEIGEVFFLSNKYLKNRIQIFYNPAKPQHYAVVCINNPKRKLCNFNPITSQRPSHKKFISVPPKDFKFTKSKKKNSIQGYILFKFITSPVSYADLYEKDYCGKLKDKYIKEIKEQLKIKQKKGQ